MLWERISVILWRIWRISQHYGSSHLPGDIMEKHMGDPLETTWTIRIVARLWISLDYYYDNPKQFANVKAIKANLNQFSPCRTGMEDTQTICWFDRNPPPKQRIISNIFTLKENYLKMGIKHLSDFKIHQPEPKHLFGWNTFPLLISFVDSRIQIQLIHYHVFFEVME